MIGTSELAPPDLCQNGLGLDRQLRSEGSRKAAARVGHETAGVASWLGSCHARVVGGRTGRTSMAYKGSDLDLRLLRALATRESAGPPVEYPGDGAWVHAA